MVISYQADPSLPRPTATAGLDTRPDYTYYGVNLPEGWRRHTNAAIVDAPVWQGEEGTYPAFSPQYLMFVAGNPAAVKFLFLSYVQLNEEVKACLRAHPEMVVIAQSNHPNRTANSAP